MMRFQILLIGFLFISTTILAQQKINGLVEDDDTGDAVSYASVTSDKGNGIVTDSTGKFSLVIRKQAKLNDSITISAAGYTSKKIALRDLLKDNRVKLIQHEITLRQVKVYASLKGDHKRFGYYRDWKVKNEGGEIGYIFDLTKNNIQVGKVQVKINHNYDTCWMKLHLRDAGPSLNLPQDEVLKREVIIPTTVKYGLVEFDLNWEAITVPANRLYVGFELLRCGCSESTAPSFFFLGNEEGENFYRETEKSIWKHGGDYTIYVRMMMK